jgi:hypothetical protein
MSTTGENEQGLRKVIDLLRLVSIFILILHFYYFCYGAWEQLGLSHEIVNKPLQRLASQTGFFNSSFYSKLFALILLLVTLAGNKGKKSEKLKWKHVLTYLGLGAVFYFGSYFLLNFPIEQVLRAYMYVGATAIGYLFILTGGAKASRLINVSLGKDIFNEENETFPQEERYINNEYSVNLPTRYQLKKKVRTGWINVVNPFRASVVFGTPGSGKSFAILQEFIRQHIQKGYSMYVYDFKFDDLSKYCFNVLLKHSESYPIKPIFCLINFDDLSKSHRCNPLAPEHMTDIMDAAESARSIMLSLNRTWIQKQGDFFVESPINFVTAIIWFLRNYQGGKYCTFPHLIEFISRKYDEIFPILGANPEISNIVNPFVEAYLNGAVDQLEGQLASAKIPLSKLTSKPLYWVMTGNDFSLDINNPQEPKVLCIGNNPDRKEVYGAALSLYNSRVVRLINRKNQLKCSVIVDELPTIYFRGLDDLIATARSNKVSVCLGLQDMSQLIRDYGEREAKAIINTVGNIFSGQVVGDTAKFLTERFGKIQQHRQSISVNRNDTPITTSTQLDYMIPASKISNLSQGTFVGSIADNFEEKIKLKTFHAEIVVDQSRIKEDKKGFVDLPVIREVSSASVDANFLKIKSDVVNIITEETQRIKNDPTLSHLIIQKATEKTIAS